ncbi:GAF domain-containing protein [Hahella sp. HN01]|uniref:GAF domain-containing protein n=1 Tax=unclassified Hahella TaxID=2624107 RepID=UPI001C1EDBF3|nr:GAF domain-containing protein [Hahella sp. HN01]MBU6953897.1 GAF domain-containing protein [Hahella sp. HN01]
MYDSLPLLSSEEEKSAHYQHTLRAIRHAIEGETDWTAILSTVVCELHHRFEYFHWTGFYRVVAHELMKVGPYQGGHGCLTIPFNRGVCGAAAREQKVQLVPDVNKFPGHIACSGTTQSEIVLPLFNANGDVAAVLDIDSDHIDAFDTVDERFLAELLTDLIPLAPSPLF